MNGLKRRILAVVGASLAVPVVHADIVSTLNNGFEKAVQIGSFSWAIGEASAGSLLMMLLRVLIIILVFTIFFAVTQQITGLKELFGGKNRRLGALVSGILAIISGIFLPLGALGAIGAGWGTAVALFLIGAPSVAIIYCVYMIPTWMKVEEQENMTRGVRFIQFVLCLLLVWILSAMYHYIGVLGGGFV